MHFSTYCEFYQKALIPMGENDRTSLLTADFQFSTHWLIALEGQPRTGEEFYLWDVAIYPADGDGTFNWQAPLYKSSLYDSIDGAYKAAQLLEQYSKNDQLSSINFKEKIS